MKPLTLGRELFSAGAILASYPFEPFMRMRTLWTPRRSRDAVVFAHGLGGDPSNLLMLSVMVRMAGFDAIGFYKYPLRQPLDVSAAQMAEMAHEADAGGGVHLIGHSFGGAIARTAARIMREGAVRSLITLGSPWSLDQDSPGELAIFGADDPIVAAPDCAAARGAMFKRIVVLRATGHLGLLHHDETVRVTLGELLANRISD